MGTFDDVENPREGYCKKQVFPNDRWGSFHPHQCSFKIWKNGYCKKHHPDTEKARKEKREKEFKLREENNPVKRLIKLQKEKEELIKWLYKKITKCEKAINKGGPFYDLDFEKKAYENVLEKIGG